VCVPFFQRYNAFAIHARRMRAAGELGPLSHFYFRTNRPTSDRYRVWGAPWMLDPAAAGGGCLRNVGLHGLDALHYVTGDAAEVTGAQLSSSALGQRVEDYASVMLRTASGMLATVEAGNTFPGPTGGDAESKLAGRDAMLVLRGGSLRCYSKAGSREIVEPQGEPLPVVAFRDALARWQRGEAPIAGPEDCYKAMRLVDRAYEIAGSPAA
jgi:predicted dehydrogenase